jgi:hypothetical protein
MVTVLAENPPAPGKNVKAVKTVASFRFSENDKEKLLERFREQAQGVRFVSDLQKIVALHISNKESHKRVGAAAAAMRSNASAIQKAARQLKKAVGLLDGGEKGLLGQLMWTVDKRRYAPAAFSVDQVAEAAYVLEEAARKLTQGGRGGRSSLQLEELIRDVYAAYVVRFNSKPDLSTAKDNGFAFALKVCLSATGEPTRISGQSLRDAINA